ncbi:hypothetical protein [Bradyrhizobium sp. th.b2]|uniref:hypothetical protein n=1 Tax=Bradyrhizobium sp. th-b2 TaxID=172088 RepID=UPI00056B16DE|nr:hypothetical protein [Bradyrhizobium sp. th.b2]
MSNIKRVLFAIQEQTSGMKHIKDDGGRCRAGYKGRAGDCVTRSICIATGLPYKEVYARLAAETGAQRRSKRTSKRPRSANHGINIRRKWFKDYMAELGFEWHPTMKIGQGCQCHLRDGELPDGRLVVRVSKHLVAVIDGAIHDTHDPSRDGTRCVYGYWKLGSPELMRRTAA